MDEAQRYLGGELFNDFGDMSCGALMIALLKVLRPLPPFNNAGELPEGVHPATLDEVLTQFGGSTPRRQAVTARLQRIYQLASATGKLTRLVIFGSYVTTKSHPNDADVIPHRGRGRGGT